MIYLHHKYEEYPAYGILLIADPIYLGSVLKGFPFEDNIKPITIGSQWGAQFGLYGNDPLTLTLSVNLPLALPKNTTDWTRIDNGQFSVESASILFGTATFEVPYTVESGTYSFQFFASEEREEYELHLLQLTDEDGRGAVVPPLPWAT
jgi:hypothetical protein